MVGAGCCGSGAGVGCVFVVILGLVLEAGWLDGMQEGWDLALGLVFLGLPAAGLSGLAGGWTDEPESLILAQSERWRHA